MPETKQYDGDDEDVKAALARDTQDGPGDLDELGESDLDHDGSAGGGVEIETED